MLQRLSPKIEITEMPTLRLAVLIDADNAQACIIQNLLQEIASLGEATVRRIYGDFTSPTSASWKSVLQQFAINPIQQYAYSKGKNATDSRLIIDAMDLLYTKTFDGFCLVSSDSDFTGLAMRIREAGLKVYGFGEKKTPEAFRNACHKFTFTEILRPKENSSPLPEDKKVAAQNIPGKTVYTQTPVESEQSLPMDLLNLLEKAVSQAASDDGWALLSSVGAYLTQIKPDFDPRSYGHKKLSDLVRSASSFFSIEQRPISGTNDKVIFIRCSGKS